MGEIPWEFKSPLRHKNNKGKQTRSIKSGFRCLPGHHKIKMEGKRDRGRKPLLKFYKNVSKVLGYYEVLTKLSKTDIMLASLKIK